MSLAAVVRPRLYHVSWGGHVDAQEGAICCNFLRSWKFRRRVHHASPDLTLILPVMCGWSTQKYSTSPGLVKVNENESLVSSPCDLNARPFSATKCGMSSWLTHLTVEPGPIVSSFGVNVKLLIATSTVFPSVGAAAGTTSDSVALLKCANASRANASRTRKAPACETMPRPPAAPVMGASLDTFDM